MSAPAGFIGKSEAATILGCQKRTVDNLMRKRQIPFYKFGYRVMFKREELIATLNKCKVTAPAPSETACNTAWDEVCRWLRIASQSADAKKRNLATQTLRFIMKFDL